MTPEERTDKLIDDLELFGNKMQVSIVLAAIRAAEFAAREQERAWLLDLIKRRWTFSGEQQHTHTWHDMADCITDIVNRGKEQK